MEDKAIQLCAIYAARPFRLDLTVGALRRAPSNQVDRWDGQVYRRVLTIGSRAFEVSMSQAGPDMSVQTQWQGVGFGAERKGVILPMLSRMLGLNLALDEWTRRVGDDARLRRLAGDAAGLKPVRFPTIFEALANAIIFRETSLSDGMAAMNRLCERLGPRHGEAFGFPSPSDLASCSANDLRALGWNAGKGEALLRLSRQIVEGTLDVDAMDAMEDAALLARLAQLPGIGRWEAEFVALRGFGRLDAVLAGDAGLLDAAQSWLGLAERPVSERLREVLSAWSPFRGMVCFHLQRRAGTPPTASSQSARLR